MSSSLNPLPLMHPIRRIVAEADPFQAVAALIDDETASRRVQLRVIGAFSVTAFLLAAIGIHGLLSFAVSQRLPEIGEACAVGRTILAFPVGVDPGDLPTFVASVILVMSAALSGTIAPAIRALRIDPASALRAE